MVNIIFALIAGVLTIMTRTITSNLSSKIGLSQGTFVNYAGGLLVSLLFFFVSKDTLNIDFAGIPAWVYTGGLIGAIIVVMSSIVVPNISAFYFTIIAFVGQLFAGIVIDYFTLGNVSIGKFIGGILVIIGLVYNLIIDKKELAK